MLNEKSESADFDGATLSDQDKEFICLVALGLTDAEIATHFEVPDQAVLGRIAEILKKLGARMRVEIVLYAFSEPALYQRITAKVANKSATTIKRLDLKAS
jgi:DNA-binding NarL/FixJ family response regulator